MADRQHLNPDTMGQPRGYSHVVKVDKTVYVVGQTGVTRDGQVAKGDPEAQARQVWRNIEAAVQSVGGTLQDVVKSTTYITNIEYTAAARKVREELFQSSKPPTSTLLVVSELAQPDFLVEIEVIAVLD